MDKRGAVLIVCLWMLAILAVMAAGLARSASLNLNQARFQREKLEAGYLCRSQITQAVAGLRTGKPVKEQSGLTIADLGARINVRVPGDLNRQLLVELLLNAGAAEPEAIGLSNTVIDWIDSDTVNMEDKEREPDFFKNQPFNNPFELLAVIEYFYEQNSRYGTAERARQLYEAMEPSISVYPESGINLNTASEGDLQIFCRAQLKTCGMSELIPSVAGLADKIIQYREKQAFEKNSASGIIAALSESGLTSEETNIINQIDSWIEVKSDHFRITSDQSAGNCRKRVKVVYNRGQNRIRDWHEH